MNVAVIGYGVEGTSSTEYWHKKGANIAVCDQNTDILLPDYVTPQLGDNYLSNLDRFDIIVRSPGIRPDAIASANPDAPNITDKVTTAINEFFDKCPAPIIGVTGTKGKGTTSTLIFKMLEAAGIKVFQGGNIGLNPLEFIDNITPDSWAILELSSFQLIDFKYAPKIGVCLMVVPEHQNWHLDVREYYDAKKQLFQKQTSDSWAIFNNANFTSAEIAKSGQAMHIPYVVPHPNIETDSRQGVYVDGRHIRVNKNIVCSIDDVALLGRHNLENVCAAIGAILPIIGQEVDIIKKVVTEFRGMEHRLEFVREIDEVKYYNDSFATTPEATVAALKSFKQPKIVILGGRDKGVPISSVIEEIVNGNVRKVIAIGETSEKIAEMLTGRGYKNYIMGCSSMTDIVNTAQRVAKSGDVVLLSTAYASFDMFKDYKERGNLFKKAANSL